MQDVRCARAGSRCPLAPDNLREVLGGRVGERAKKEENEVRAQERPRPSRRWRALRSGAATAAVGRAAIESRGGRTDGPAFAGASGGGASVASTIAGCRCRGRGMHAAGPAPASLVHAFCLRAAGLAAAGSACPSPPPLPPPPPPPPPAALLGAHREARRRGGWGGASRRRLAQYARGKRPPPLTVAACAPFSSPPPPSHHPGQRAGPPRSYL